NSGGTQLTSAASQIPRQLLGTRHAVLEYKVGVQGPSGVSKVEVWITRDEGQTWRRLGEDPDRTSPVEFDLPGEGLFGVSLVLYNGAGFGGTPPVKGDLPDCWIEVDTTKPTAKILGVLPGSGEDTGALYITWTASDRNLKADPISLFYATKREGPWVPISHNMRNSGTYRWQPPHDVGCEFFLRLDVTDAAGNVARCETPQPVVVDMVKPKAQVLSINGSPPR